MHDALTVASEILDFYNEGRELGRLSRGIGLLEAARTRELLERFLPPAPAEILDVGGGPGIYSLWLADRGYSVHLVEPVALHVKEALAVSAQAKRPLASARLGDARNLEFPDGFADAVLLMGPLYHLTERADRLVAVSEARRACKVGGKILVAAVGRSSYLLYWLFMGRPGDPLFDTSLELTLPTGLHRNPDPNVRALTTAFFHRPDELRAELVECGLEDLQVLAVEGPGSLVPDFEARWEDADYKQRLLAAVRATEADPALLGMSAHLMAIGTRT